MIRITILLSIYHCESNTINTSNTRPTVSEGISTLPLFRRTLTTCSEIFHNNKKKKQNKYIERKRRTSQKSFETKVFFCSLHPIFFFNFFFFFFFFRYLLNNSSSRCARGNGLKVGEAADVIKTAGDFGPAAVPNTVAFKCLKKYYDYSMLFLNLSF